MTIVAAFSPAWRGQNILLGYVSGLAKILGVPFRWDKERDFLTSLKGRGLPENDVQVLARLLEGKPVKLHQYQSAVQDLEKRVEETLRKRLEVAKVGMEMVHEEAMRALASRELTGVFVGHTLLETFLHLQMGYTPPGGLTDVSCDFRHFVENEGLLDLFPLARQYVTTAVAVGEEKERWEAFVENRRVPS